MSYGLLVFFLAAAATHVNCLETNDLCPCNEPEIKDDTLLWVLMKKLSVDIAEEDKDMFTVLPGELTPLIDCSCDEYNRKKRKTADEPEQAPVAVETVTKQRKIRRYIDTSCPIGHRRFGIRCVEEDYFDY